MKILAFDTATEYCSTALWLDGEVREINIHARQTHSQLLLPHCKQLLAEADIGLAQLDGIAWGCGPGSFTGLRIGCSVAQGLAFGVDLPVVSIVSLLALTTGGDGERVISCTDARMGEVYHAAYQREGVQWRCVSVPQVCAPTKIPLIENATWMGCGNAFAVYGEMLAHRLGHTLVGVDAARYPTGRSVAEFARIELSAGRGILADDVAPLYVRDRVARKICER